MLLPHVYRRPDPPRSIVGLPIVSCRDPRYGIWVLLVLLLDLTYSAFLLPLSIGFQVSRISQPSWVLPLPTLTVLQPSQHCDSLGWPMVLPASLNDDRHWRFLYKPIRIILCAPAV
jgi:hypothetical protein